MPEDYKVQISTPADLSGFARLDAAVKGNVAGINQLGASADSSFRNMLASVDGAIAAQRGKSAGLVSQMNATAQATSALGTRAASAAMSFANFGTASVAAISAAGAAAKLLDAALSKIGEDNAAEAALKKFGVSAGEAAANAALLNNLELFTGNRVQAAEMFARAINGNYRELRQFGIELDETATKQEALAALNELGSRGLDAHAQKLSTVSGQLENMGKRVVDVTAYALKQTNSFLGTTKALEWWSVNLLKNKTALELQIDALNARLPALQAARTAQDEAAASAARQAAEERKLAAAMDDFSEAAHRAANAQENVNLARAEAARAAMVEDARGDTELAGKLDKIGIARMTGKLTPAAADRMVSAERAKAEFAKAERENQRAQAEEQRLRDQFAEAEARQGEQIAARDAMPAGEGRAAATAQIAALGKTIQSLDQAIKEANAKSAVAAEGVMQKHFSQQEVQRNNYMSERAEREAADLAKRKAALEKEAATARAVADRAKAAVSAENERAAQAPAPGPQRERGLHTSGLSRNTQEENARIAAAAGAVPKMSDALSRLTSSLVAAEAKVAAVQARLKELEERATASK